MHRSYRIDPGLCARYCNRVILLDGIGEIGAILLGGVTLYRKLFYRIFVHMAVVQIILGQVGEAVSGFTVFQSYALILLAILIQNNRHVGMHRSYRIDPGLCAGYCNRVILLDGVSEIITILLRSITIYKLLSYRIHILMAIRSILIQILKAIEGLTIFQGYTIELLAIPVQNNRYVRMHRFLRSDPGFRAGNSNFFLINGIYKVISILLGTISVYRLFLHGIYIYMPIRAIFG